MNEKEEGGVEGKKNRVGIKEGNETGMKEMEVVQGEKGAKMEKSTKKGGEERKKETTAEERIQVKREMTKKNNICIIVRNLNVKDNFEKEKKDVSQEEHKMHKNIKMIQEIIST